MYLRKPLLQPPRQVEEILERQVRMEATHDVKFCYRFRISRSRRLECFLQGHGVCPRGVLLTPKRAQAAIGHTHIGRVDMAVYVEVGIVSMHPLAHIIRQPSDSKDVLRLVER